MYMLNEHSNTDIFIGTRNPYKAGEMEYLLEGIPNVNICFLKDTDIDLNIEEDGESLTENAQKKAIEISKHTDMYVLASDGGVDIPGLGDKWDILRNQRIVGHDNTDLEKANELLLLMNGLKGEQRKVEYHLAVALAFNGKIVWSGEDITDRGYIVEKLVDENIPSGFWMGHIWYYPKYNQISTRISKEEQIENRELEDGLKKRLRNCITST